MSENPAATSPFPPPDSGAALKVALVILHADPRRGGAERYTVDLAAALAKRGHDPALLASSFASEVPVGLRVKLDDSGVTRSGKYRTFLESLEAHLRRTRYDVVHAMLPVRRCDIYHPHAGMAVAKRAATGWRLAFNYRRHVMAQVERELLEGLNAPVVLALSNYVRRSIRELYPLDDARLPILFNAVDLDRFQPPRAKPARDKVNALFIGQDFVRKGLRQTLAALAKLKDRRLHLSIVGRRPRNFHIPVLAPVTHVGEVKDPRPYYAGADFFVLPTRHDPCSLVVLEALAMGLPVISTRFNGACEIMTDGVHGFVLDDPDNVDALADAMRKMLDPDRRRAMSEACLALRPKLSYEHHLDELVRIYRRVKLESRTHV